MITKCFHGVMLELLDSIRAKRPAETSIAAHLLDIKDPDTGDTFSAVACPAMPMSAWHCC